MFVTCLYAVLDPATGDVTYANAGHNLPYARTGDGVVELRATGWPLGLMPGVTYEEKHTVVAPGDNVLLYSDGLVEAHDPSGEMFGNPRLTSLMHDEAAASTLIDRMLTSLANFTGPDHEQEDDITLVALERTVLPWSTRLVEPDTEPAVVTVPNAPENLSVSENLRTLLEFSLPSVPGNERIAMDRVAEVTSGIGLPPEKLERLKTAVAEATMNAIEHGNDNREELPVSLRVTVSGNELVVRIIDQGGNEPIPDPQTPDLEAKLAGLQTPRGWGLFLIKNMVDDLRVTSDATHHALELVFRLNEGEAAGERIQG
jgi:anti-sigma regulatory factor (Ser/Thr protein kinase)